MIFIVNRELLTLKCLYFFQLSIIACLYIYMTPFMSEWGVTATEMAIINVVANIFALFSRPIFGYLADRYQKYKMLLITLSLLCAIVYSLHLASPKHIVPPTYSLTESYKLNISSDKTIVTIYASDQSRDSCWPSNLTQCIFRDRNNWNFDLSLETRHQFHAKYVPQYQGNVSFTKGRLSISCQNITSHCNTSMGPFYLSSNSVGLTWSSTFWILGLAKTIGFIVYSPLVSLTDAVTFVTLGPSNAHKYGFTRMFGTIGVLVFSVIIGGVLQAASLLAAKPGWILTAAMQQFSQFTLCFVAAALVFFAIMITASFLRIEKPIKTDSIIKSLNILYRDWEIGIFFVFTVLGGFILQVFAEFFFLTVFKRHPTLPKYFPGLITVVMTVSESLAFGFSSHLLRHRSYEIWISLSFIMWSLRWFTYIYINNFWLHLLTELLHGPSFGLMLSCMMSHVGKLGTETTHGRLQGLFSGIYFNIGGALGGFVGGILLDNLGMYGLYTFMSILSLLCSLYYPIQRFLVPRLCKAAVNEDEFIKIDDIGNNITEKPMLPSNNNTGKSEDDCTETTLLPVNPIV